MDIKLISQLLEETILLAEEEGAIEECIKFKEFICEMLPSDILLQLEEINGDSAFLEDLWSERFEREVKRRANKAAAAAMLEQEEELLEDGLCLICERKVRLTRHHVYPRETHRQLLKKGYEAETLNTTIAICRMCHSTVHRFFTNNELAAKFYTVDMLLSDDRMLKYAKWASAQSNGRYNKPL